MVLKLLPLLVLALGWAGPAGGRTGQRFLEKLVDIYDGASVAPPAPPVAPPILSSQLSTPFSAGGFSDDSLLYQVEGLKVIADASDAPTAPLIDYPGPLRRASAIPLHPRVARSLAREVTIIGSDGSTTIIKD